MSENTESSGQRSTEPLAQTSRLSDARFALVGTVLYALIVGFVVLHHELWRDEAQAWMIARAAQGYLDLLRGGPRLYEGHPFLWYWLLYTVRLFTHRPEAMQAVCWGLGVGSAYLLLSAPVIPRWLRAVMLASYFFSFEYVVLARSYGLELFLALLATRLALRQKPPLVVIGLLSGAVVCTYLPGLALVPVIMVGPFWPALRDLVWAARGVQRRLPGRDWWLGILACGLLCLLAAVTTRNPPDAMLTPEFPALSWTVLQDSGIRTFRAAVPLSVVSPNHEWWNSWLPEFLWPGEGAAKRWVYFTIGAGFALGALRSLRHDRPLALAFGASLFSSLLLSVLTDKYQYRHVGQIAVAYALALLLCRDARAQRGRWRGYGWVLVPSVVSTLLMFYADIRWPFSMSREAADYIRDRRWEERIVGVQGYIGLVPVNAYLDRAYVNVRSGQSNPYMLWNTKMHGDRRKKTRPEHEADEPERLVRLAKQSASTRQEPVLVVATRPLKVGKELRDALSLVASFKHRPTEPKPLEEYFIYEVWP